MATPPGTSTSFQVRGFRHVQADQAQNRITPKASIDECSIHRDHLILTSVQKTTLDALYASHAAALETHVFDAADVLDQLKAAAYLASCKLDIDSKESVDNKWSVRWSDRGHDAYRVLYQCSCGYDHTVRGSKSRHAPVDFTGCLAHCEVQYEVATQRVLAIRGYLEHNAPCQTAPFTEQPVFPMHPSVTEVALKGLLAGASMSAVIRQNVRLQREKRYVDQIRNESPDSRSHFRYHIHWGDARSLYRQLHRLRGIKITEPDHINLHSWLDPNSPQHRPELLAAIFHYAPRVLKSDRLEVCLMTSEMKEAGWKYAHHSQILLDGTFGICNKKMLLFIVMAVDKRNHGVPLAFLLFSAPRNNTHTAAGYNTEILVRLLGRWKEAMGREASTGEPFNAWVAITDTDLMERAALLLVFPEIVLLICKFHLRQSWKNHRIKCIKGTTVVHTQLKSRVHALEDELVNTREYADAEIRITNVRKALEAERADLQREQALLNSAGGDLDSHAREQREVFIAESLDAISGALRHVTYLMDYWLREALWCSWSLYGRERAAQRLARLVNEVLVTTNHLESFNGILKRMYLAPEQKSGRPLRLDVLIMLLIMQVFPAIFQKRAVESAWEAQRRQRLLLLRGGDALVAKMDAAGTTSASFSPLAYLTDDADRNAGAASIVTENQISVPLPDATGLYYTFSCFSSNSLYHEQSLTTYTVTLGTDGTGSCSCKDFQSRGGACKHMRAALVRAVILRQNGEPLPILSLPSSLEDAQAIRNAPAASVEIPDPIEEAARAIQDLLLESGSTLDDTEDEEEDMVEDEEMHSRELDIEIRGTHPRLPGDHEMELRAPPVVAASKVPDLTDFPSTSQSGLNEQTIARVLFSLATSTTLPYASFTELLRQVRGQTSSTDELRALRTRVEHDAAAFLEQLDRVIHDSDSDSSRVPQEASPQLIRTHLPSQEVPMPAVADGDTPTAHAIAAPLRRRKKRAIPNIIGASPEKKQRRHDSFGVH